MLEFTTAEPLAVYEFLDFCDELDDPFDYFFYSYMSEIRLLCMCKGCRN